MDNKYKTLESIIRSIAAQTSYDLRAQRKLKIIDEAETPVDEGAKDTEFTAHRDMQTGVHASAPQGRKFKLVHKATGKVRGVHGSAKDAVTHHHTMKDKADYKVVVEEEGVIIDDEQHLAEWLLYETTQINMQHFDNLHKDFQKHNAKNYHDLVHKIGVKRTDEHISNLTKERSDLIKKHGQPFGNIHDHAVRKLKSVRREYIDNSNLEQQKQDAQAHAADQNEEAITELSQDTIKKYTSAAKQDKGITDFLHRQTGKESWKQYAERRAKGLKLADKKLKEETEIDEGRMKELSMDLDGKDSISDKDFYAKYRRTKAEWRQSLKRPKPEEKKPEPKKEETEVDESYRTRSADTKVVLQVGTGKADHAPRPFWKKERARYIKVGENPVGNKDAAPLPSSLSKQTPGQAKIVPAKSMMDINPDTKPKKRVFEQDGYKYTIGDQDWKPKKKVSKDEFGNVIKDKNRARHLARKGLALAMQKKKEVKEGTVYQDGPDFYDSKSGKVVKSYKHLVKGDSDLEGAKKAREQFKKDHPEHVFEGTELRKYKRGYNQLSARARQIAKKNNYAADFPEKEPPKFGKHADNNKKKIRQKDLDYAKAHDNYNEECLYDLDAILEQLVLTDEELQFFEEGIQKEPYWKTMTYLNHRLGKKYKAIDPTLQPHVNALHKQLKIAERAQRKLERSPGKIKECYELYEAYIDEADFDESWWAAQKEREANVKKMPFKDMNLHKQFDNWKPGSGKISDHDFGKMVNKTNKWSRKAKEAKEEVEINEGLLNDMPAYDAWKKHHNSTGGGSYHAYVQRHGPKTAIKHINALRKEGDHVQTKYKSYKVRMLHDFAVRGLSQAVKGWKPAEEKKSD